MGGQHQNGSTRNWLGFMDWMDLDQDQDADKWLDVVNAAIKLLVPRQHKSK